MSDDTKPKPEPRAELEDRLVQRSMEPYKKALDEDEQEGMELFLHLFVKTHPVMRRMVDRRVKEDAALQAAKRVASAPPVPPAPVQTDGGEARAVEASGVVPKEGGDIDPREAGASGVISKGPETKAKAGGEP